LVHALVEQAGAIARAHGRTFSDGTARGLEETLRAALADEEVGRVLLDGRLTVAVRPGGFDEAAVTDGRTRRRPAPTSRDAVAKELEAAKRHVDDAVRAHDLARDEAHDADVARRAADGDVDRLRGALDEARRAAADADRRWRERDDALRRARRALADAERHRADVLDYLGRRDPGRTDGGSG
jgi:chromosome segregation ATPase